MIFYPCISMVLTLLDRRTPARLLSWARSFNVRGPNTPKPLNPQQLSCVEKLCRVTGGEPLGR
jgi:hypothetical protein